MKKMKLKIQLFALGADGPMAYKQYEQGVNTDVESLTKAYAQLYALSSEMSSLVNRLSGIELKAGVAAKGEYTDALKCVKGALNKDGLQKNMEDALSRAENVLRTTLKVQGKNVEAFMEDLNNFSNTIELFFYDVIDEEYAIIYDKLQNQGSIKYGDVYTNLYQNGYKSKYEIVEYNGEFVEFYNKDGLKVKAPLATFKCVDGKVICEPMTLLEKSKYIVGLSKYHGDIMEKLAGTSEKFQKEILDRTKNITFIYRDPNSKEEIEYGLNASAYVTSFNNSNILNMAVFTDQFMDTINGIHSQEVYDYMTNAFIHECGHVYGNSDTNDDLDRDRNSTWNEIYSQVVSNSANEENIGLYTNAFELYAESSRYYYSAPERLKMVEIDVDGYTNLYDYMDNQMK